MYSVGRVEGGAMGPRVGTHVGGVSWGATLGPRVGTHVGGASWGATLGGTVGESVIT